MQTFLFLQGHPSSFARHLGRALEAAGCRVLRINFCVGDWLYWLGRPATNYRGRFEDWAGYLRDYLEREKITDILYYGDCRPYHQVAAEIARERGIRAITYEFGYLRPDWITLERTGMSTRSHFPNDPDRIREIAAQFGPADLESRFSFPIAVELTHEVFYHLSSYFLHAFFWNYRSDRYYNPLVEYITGIPKQFDFRSGRRADRLVQQLIGNRTPFFLFPLQLQNDYQLRCNAPFAHQSDAIREAIASFANNADSAAHLIFKCHPLDNGGEGWPGHVKAAAEANGISERVHYIDGGNLQRILQRARGTVLINSTVGMHAIVLGRPAKVLGGALFDIDGLTHQGNLDSFWSAPTKPDRDLADALVRALAGTIQIKGNFFSKAGRAAAIPVCVERLTGKAVNGSGAFVDPPPRLATMPSRASQAIK